MDTPLILISNDDGIDAPGIHRLIDYVAGMGDIYVVAPVKGQSGQSSAITVNSPLRLKELEPYKGARMFTVSGTPVDCVKLGLHAALPRKPDFMLSGINHGSNAGNSLIYSGTMGAAMEACLNAIPAVGYSLLDHSMGADFAPCMPYITQITKAVIENGLPKGTCLNVNFPAHVDIKGIKVVRAAHSHWTEEYRKYEDPNHKSFYWLTGRQINEEPGNPETDLYWLDRGYGTVVPAKADQSDVSAIEFVSKILC